MNLLPPWVLRIVAASRRPTNKLLHALFTFGAALGNELFFITFLPLLFWEGYEAVGRRVVVMLAW